MSKINELIQTLCPDGVEYKVLPMISVNCDRQRKAITSGKRIAGSTPYYGASGIVDYVEGYIFDGVYLLVSEDGANLLARSTPIAFSISGKTWVNNHAHVLKFENDVTRKFVEYFLNSIDLSPYITSGAQPKLNQDNLNSIEIPVPPFRVQEEIVCILDEYAGLEAELEAKLSEEIELKQKQYEYCASKLFEDLNVEYTPMSELAKFKYGYTDKASDSGNARFIRITDIDDFGELSSADEKYIMLTDGAKKYLLTKGSLVVARTGATYGKTLYFDSDEPSVYASFLIKIDFDNNQVLNRYYWHFTKTALYWEQANKYVKVGGQQQFNSPALGRVCVPVPSITEQQRIVEILDKYDTYTRDMISTLNTELESRKKQYAYYRDQLLTFKRKE